jgi:hypothetical protein
MINFLIYRENKQEIKLEVRISDLRCDKGVGVSFWDLNVRKRILRDFLEVFLVLKVRYEGMNVCDVSMCTVLRF